MRLLLTLCALFLSPVLALAQTTVNPTRFDIVPASDYSLVGAIDGLPIVTSLDVLVSTQAQPATTIGTLSCGKPAVTAGEVICPISQAFRDTLPKNVVLVAKARANGQPGTTPGVSAIGGPFGFAGATNPLPPGAPAPQQ